MEEEWYADRRRRRTVLHEHPDWPASYLAAALSRSVGWVKQWKRRLREAPPADEAALRGRSRARHRPPPSIGQAVVERILALRDDPPANLQRVPGPKAIRYYLGQDIELVASGVRLPRSTRTIWRILVQHGRIARPSRRQREPLARPPPLAHWQLDVKDVTSVLPEPGGKRAHVVAARTCVDGGPSLVVATVVRGDCTEETAVAAVADILRAHGVPRAITVDRDTCVVGSPRGRDVPAPFVRFLTCLGGEVDSCPPRRPQKHCSVERYHGTLDRECLTVHRPTTREQARAATAAFRHHDTHERPNQASSGGRLPPRAAFPVLPTQPAWPERVDPDRWLADIHGRRFVRKVRREGSILVAEAISDVKQALAGQHVTVEVDAKAKALVIQHRQKVLKRPPITGLRGESMAFSDDLTLIQREARSDWRAWLRRGRAA